MICYKDMTFCGFKNCKHFDNGCPRSLTEAVEKKAALYNLPIAQYIDKPPCYQPETTVGQLAPVLIGEKRNG